MNTGRITHIVTTVIARIGKFFHDLLTGFEPVAARQLVAIVVTLAGSLGLSVGDFPAKAEAVIVALTALSLAYAGWSARRQVVPQKRLTENVIGYDSTTDTTVVALPADVAAKVPTTIDDPDEPAARIVLADEQS